MIKIVSLVVLTISLGSCKKDFLEVVPKGVAIATRTSDYELLLNIGLNGVGRASNVVMSDELAGYAPLYTVGGAGIAQVSDQKAFEYQDDIYLPIEKDAELTQLEKQLYTYNKIINEVMDSKEGSETQKKAIRAEALAGRAWVNFTLVNYYGKPYKAATAASDPGIPLATVADVTQTTFTRSSVQAAYELIIADLTTAIADLPVQIVSRQRMSRSAAEAILGKVYVNMQAFDKALPLFTSSIKDLSTSSIPIGLYDFNAAFATGGSFLPLNPITGPSRVLLSNDKEVLYLKNFINYYGYISSSFPISRQTAELYSAADLRLNFFTALPALSTTAYSNQMMRCYGRYTNMGINVPDIYLLKAECESRLGDLPEAVKSLLAVRKTRMKNDSANANAADVPANVAADQIALTKYILEERIREFASMGERWWDMRRLSVDETYRSTVGMVHQVYDAAGNVVKSFPLKPERLTFRFPQYIVDANPGLGQNP